MTWMKQIRHGEAHHDNQMAAGFHTHAAFERCGRVTWEVRGNSQHSQQERVCRLQVLPMEVKKSTWAERDCRPLSNNTHQHHTAILEKEEHP